MGPRLVLVLGLVLILVLALAFFLGLVLGNVSLVVAVVVTLALLRIWDGVDGEGLEQRAVRRRASHSCTYTQFDVLT